MARTPWGMSQVSRQIAPGIVRHDTSSHGGIHLDRARMSKLNRTIGKFETFAGGPWFEEDCDVAAVVIAFPEAFSEKSVGFAVESAIWSAKTNDLRFARVLAYVRDNAALAKFLPEELVLV